MQGVILNPSGNITALVLTDSLPDNKQEIAKNIMQKSPTIEQVGFLSPENKTLIMAGGEFCANAARAAIWQLLDGKLGKTALSVSGYNGTVYGSVGDDGKVCMELAQDFWRSTSIDTNMIGLVHLQGISHLIVPMQQACMLEADGLKEIAKAYLQKFGLLSYAAAGVMFVSSVDTTISLYPVVWVRDMQTFFLESACGSGTIAYALYTYQLAQLSRVSVLQPSGSVLEVALSDRKICLLGEVSFVGNV